jgi:hypothetical protein
MSPGWSFDAISSAKDFSSSFIFNFLAIARLSGATIRFRASTVRLGFYYFIRDSGLMVLSFWVRDIFMG